MKNSTIRHQADRAVQFTTEGMDLLVEISEMQAALNSKLPDGSATSLIQEIIAKEKMAVSLIQQATLIQRDLMKLQHESIEKIARNL